ncbi:hypothetical protein GGI04_001723 [Coemansia thaxteri]|uniref:RING-type domain-containing protein n=1 Tax=Coemansia thaxteri TaxID=2663907 RepID=A0A9W8BGB8_9FUNG|nr:hypothetical protein H4R26_005015 [Coemansia thaxteri]KAJ2006871.1 hypothetical protein GGI04_001723 [Coemansia thaxteri]KAJ2479162.1 hypothetical protein EV174_004096 [Coemansia sp. RSA 2320]
MPARHPLGVQSEAEDLSAVVMERQTSPMAAAVAAAAALPRALPLPTRSGPSSQSDYLTPLGIDDDDDDEDEYSISEPTQAEGAAEEAEGTALRRASSLALTPTAETGTNSQAAATTAGAGSGGGSGSGVAKCPICLCTICEAFMTACGHSFCYGCISRHLSERATCPTCHQTLDGDQIYPNFALNQLINAHDSEAQGAKGGPNIVQQIRSSVESNEALDAEDIDALLVVLQQKKQAMRSQERRFEMTTMRQFLVAAQTKKLAEMDVLRRELGVVEEDLRHVAAQLKGSSSLRLASGQSRHAVSADSSSGPQVPNALTADDGTVISDSGGASQQQMDLQPRSRRVEDHYADLESFYFNTRMRGVGGSSSDGEGLDEFLETLTTFARYEQFRPVATLRYGDSTASTAIVASIEFDRDEELFAVAGVTRKIKIYDYANVIQQADTWSDLAHTAQQRRQQRQKQAGAAAAAAGGRPDWWNREGGEEPGGEGGAFVPTALQYPTAEFTNRSKISCLSFNPYIKAQLACSDYDGTVSLWDVGAETPTMNLGEHEKRAWSVDFSQVDPTRLCSGSDDGKVKIWTTNRRSSVMTIEGKANVCCVRFNPLHGNILSFGSADHNVHCFDLRSPKQPLCVLRGHRKAVSYTRFLSPDEIISASTDSSLKLWNMRTQECVRTFQGHANEKNFVGLTTSGSDWIACGSENNTMYAYYRNLSHPAVTHKFGNCNPVTGVEQPEDDPSLFVSAVCWKSRTNTMLSANSQGIIKVLELV